LPIAPDSYPPKDYTAAGSEVSSHSFVISFIVRFITNGSVTVLVEASVTGKSTVKVYELHYVTPDNVMLTATSNHVTHGLGDCRTWRRFTRDLSVDLQKGVAHKYIKNRHHAPRLTLRRVVRIDFRGTGYVENVTLTRHAHLALFYDAADWFLRHQDERGAWPIDVTRKLADGKLELAPGWYSAMAQGHAMSVLARAWSRTRRKEYLDAALRAVEIFSVASERGGVRAIFAEHYPWYEEYPTTPSSFVLNGFIYSLIGLYDLYSVAPPGQGDTAQKLYRDGVTSLETMLALYDTGSGSVYDLRHVTLAGNAPNLARWDYHATHINQLLLLATIEKNPLYNTVARRWIGYMHGKRALHN